MFANKRNINNKTLQIRLYGIFVYNECMSIYAEQISLFKSINTDKPVIKFIDLFAGLGGIRLGFEQAFNEMGYETQCILTSEIKPHAIKALEANFKHENLVGDICKIDANSIDDFDFLLAGFPCQAFSAAGKGLGFLDTRGTLFFEVERILKAKKPYGFILENVEGLVLHDRVNSKDSMGRTLQTILLSLENLGYNVSWRLIECQIFGIPQLRKRVFITGTLKSKVNINNFDVKNSKLADILEKNKPVIKSHFTDCLLKHYKPQELYGKAIKDKRGGVNNIHSWDIELKGHISKQQSGLMEMLFKERRKKHWAEEIGIKWMDGMPLTLNQINTFASIPNLKILLDDLVEKNYLVKEHPKDIVKVLLPNGKYKEERQQDITKEKGYNIVSGKLSFEFTKILDPNSIAPTLVATDISHLGVIDGEGIRKLTIREGLRMFGYPESYNLDFFNNSKTNKLKAFDLLGNTVVVPAIKNIALRLANTYKKDNVENNELLYVS